MVKKGLTGSMDLDGQKETGGADFFTDNGVRSKTHED